MGEDPVSRGRLVRVPDGPLSKCPLVTKEAVEAVVRGVWRLAFVLVLALAALFAVGWVIQSLGSEPAPSDVTTAEHR